MKTGGNTEQDFQWEENSGVHAVHIGSLTYWESWVRTLLLIEIFVIILFGQLVKFVNVFILHNSAWGKLPPIYRKLSISLFSYEPDSKPFQDSDALDAG